MKRNILAVTIGAATLAFCGCKSSHHGHHGTVAHGKSGMNRAAAIAVLNPTAGNNVRGKVFFIPETEGVRVSAEITGLTPGKHGFHIHEKGDCSAPDGSSAGGHFNPDQMQHGGPSATMRHAGDFGNVTADANGVARYEQVDSHLKLEGPSSIIGKGVIVHAKEDDLVTQPTGNAGGRVACGVIEKQ